MSISDCLKGGHEELALEGDEAVDLPLAAVLGPEGVHVDLGVVVLVSGNSGYLLLESS